MANSNNRQVVPEAKAALNQMKLEIANELGMANYEAVDKGNLTASQNQQYDHLHLNRIFQIKYLMPHIVLVDMDDCVAMFYSNSHFLMYLCLIVFRSNFLSFFLFLF